MERFGKKIGKGGEGGVARTELKLLPSTETARTPLLVGLADTPETN